MVIVFMNIDIFLCYRILYSNDNEYDYILI